MAFVDYFRGERIRGRVIDVYDTDSDIAAVVEAGNGSRYSVNFKVENNLSNLYGLLVPQRKSLEKLVKPQMYIDVAAQYSKSPFKTAYRLNQVSSKPIYNQARAFAYRQQPQG
jgi:predicted nucleotidyltransferase